MTSLYVALADLIAISVLCFAVYYPRHRRRELLVAFLGVNVGVLAVTTALVSSDATLGLGLGLFGVCPSSGCAPSSWASTKWPTTSPPWPWGCSADSAR